MRQLAVCCELRSTGATADRGGAGAGPGALPRHGEVGGVQYTLQEVRDPGRKCPLQITAHS